MRPHYVIFLGFLFAVGTLISLTFGGNWLSGTEVDITNSMTVFRDANIAGYWTMTLPNIDFFFTGLKSLMMMDFGFFQGPLQIVQLFFLLTISLGAMWGLYIVVISVVQSALGRR